MRTLVFAASLATMLGVSVGADAMTFTYRLSGSTLTECSLTKGILDQVVEPARPCTPQERARYRPPDGPTLDGTFRIDEGRLLEQGLDGLVNRSYWDEPSEFGARDDIFKFDLANVVVAPVDQNFFGMQTDARRRPIVWGVSLNVVIFNFEPGPETFFGNAEFLSGEIAPVAGESRAAYALFEGTPFDNTIVRWSGDGGKLSLVPVPFAGLLLLSGLAALGGLGWRRGSRRV